MYTYFFMLVLAALIACPVAGAAIEIVVVDGQQRPLENVVITTGKRPEEVAETRSVSIEQRGQQFQPRVTVVMPGTTIRFPNRDLTQHHVYSFSSAKTFEIELYGGDEPSPIPFDTAGIVALGCNIHDWMLGYVYVTPDTIFGTTNVDGRLELDVTLAADDEITYWHPALRTATPLTTTFSDLERNVAGEVRLTLDTIAEHPIFREEDPLQSLFGDRR